MLFRSELDERTREHLTPDQARLVMQLPLRELARIWRSPARWQHPVQLALSRLPQAAQEGIAAGFEFLGRRR